MRALSLLLILAGVSASSFAQSPTDEQIPYQAVLSDGGAPIADGDASLIFSLVDADGSFWTESATVSVTDGAFSHRLGSVETITGIDFSRPVSVGLTYFPPTGPARAFAQTPLGAVPTARFAQTAGTVSLPLSGTVSTTPSGAAISVTNTGSGAGVSVASAGSAFRVIDAGGDGVQILSAGDDGIEILAASDNGLVVMNAADDGVFIDAAGERGVHVETAGGDGFSVETAFGDGLFVGQAQDDGVRVGSAGLDGLTIADAGDDGVDIGTVDGDGIAINAAGVDGVFVAASAANGFNIGLAGGDGVFINRTADQGVDIGTTGDTDFDGTPETTADGVNVAWAGGDGMQVVRANRYGVRAEGDLGNYLGTDATGTISPDLTLGGLPSTDNGVIRTDPAYPSSDLFMVSNDNVTVYLDLDEDLAVAQFQILDGDNKLLFKVTENGGTTATHGLFGAETAVRIDDPSAPTARTLTLPSVVSSERLVAFSGNVTTDAFGTAVVRLPDFADGVAGDFRYQLTVIGSFAQAIVGEKVSGGAFTVRTSEPGVEVSWRVEGVRQDAWARANAHEALATKDQPGTYLHPAAFGAPPDAVATQDDPESEITPEGRAQLDREAEDARETDRRDADAQARRDAEAARQATPPARRGADRRG